MSGQPSSADVLEPPRIVLVDNYDSYTWNLFQLLWQLSGTRPTVVRNDDPSGASVLRAATHVVIGPGPGTPASAADFGLGRTVVSQVHVPCLGVCLGHQGIAHVLGGTVGPARAVMHGRTSRISHTGTGLFRGVPQGFSAVRYHSLAVLPPVPGELDVTAWTADGTVMGLSHRTRPLHGLQFHPESIGTEHGGTLLRNFLDLRAGGSRSLAPVRVRARTVASAGPPADQLAPTRLRYTELHADLPVAQLFERLADGCSHAFWLDSARSAYGMGRYSYLGAVPAAACVRVDEGSAFDLLRSTLRERALPSGRSPVPFAGGYVGYLGYGTKAVLGTGAGSAAGEPDAELMFVDRFVAVDHQTGRRYLIAVDLGETEAQEWFDEVAQLAARPASRGREGPPVAPPSEVRASVDAATYRRHFATVQDWLRSGNSYEACYTYRIRARSAADPLRTYLRLRELSPAPYAALLRFGDRWVLSSSPERFVTVDADGSAETKPIKGTAARCADPVDDERARELLASDEKARSENLMIVDLLRNDLGQVCEAGTVHVPSLMAVESYATVHQLVTTVRGQLRSDQDGVDCVRALFPGGSMTGAPKKRTVELLDGLEIGSRGVYAGCLGFFGLDGQIDQSIVIRTIVWDGDAVNIGVGGAITVMSDVEDEYRETQLKASVLLQALGLDGAPPMGPRTAAHDMLGG